MQEHQDGAQLLEVINAQLSHNFGQLLIKRFLVLRETARHSERLSRESLGVFRDLRVPRADPHLVIFQASDSCETMPREISLRITTMSPEDRDA